MKRWLAVLALVLAGTMPLQQDLPGTLRVRPGFTVYAVTLEGDPRPLAHYDGRRWQAACEPLVDAPVAAPGIVGIRGSYGAPLRTVTLMPASSARWEPAWKAVGAVARRVAGSGLRFDATEITVYEIDGVGTPAVFVDLVLRTASDAWAGVAAAGWVRVDADGATVSGARVARFASYDEYLGVARLSPLGVADTGDPDRRTWVMRERRPDGELVQLFDVSNGSAAAGPRVPAGGC
ncbi:MAG: hypothetical protein AB1635_19845 [Acidobacteriota bacterium]